MSDLTNLSFQYQRRAEFAQHVNDAVLMLKRQMIANPRQVDQGTIDFLTSALSYLIRRLNDDRPEGEKLVPEEVVHDLSAHAAESSPYFREDLVDTLSAIEQTSINTGHWHTLEQLCTLADRVASASYRRLRRR